MLHAGAGTLVTPALGSVVSVGLSAQHAVQPALVTETCVRLLLFICQVTTGSGAWRWVPAVFLLSVVTAERPWFLGLSSGF